MSDVKSNEPCGRHMSLKAWRVQFNDWMAIAYAATRGRAAFLVVQWYGLDPDSFLAARVYRLPKLDGGIVEEGVDESYNTWHKAGFDPHGEMIVYD